MERSEGERAAFDRLRLIAPLFVRNDTSGGLLFRFRIQESLLLLSYFCDVERRRNGVGGGILIMRGSNGRGRRKNRGVIYRGIYVQLCKWDKSCVCIVCRVSVNRAHRWRTDEFH